MHERINKTRIYFYDSKCLVGNPSNEYHKSLGGVFVKEMPTSLMNIWSGRENLYYHEDLNKSLEINLRKLEKSKINAIND